MLELYRNTTSILKIRPSSSDRCTKRLMGENVLTVTVNRTSPFEFLIGDHLFFAGERYTLNQLPRISFDGRRYEYDLTLEGIEYELRKVHFLFYTETLGFPGGADFALMGNAETFVRVIVENLNRVQSGWSIGEVDETEYKNLAFSGSSCLEVINRLAEEFETEYWIGQNKTVNLSKRGSIIPVSFEYGKGNGLYAISRDNVSSKDIVTRLYPYGSEGNLPKNYRGNAKRLRLDPEFLEMNTDKYGIIESSKVFDGIRPEREGTITSLGGDIFTFSDSGMDFDLNATDEGNTLYIINGVKPKVQFQTGDLAGYEFECISYIHATKTFKFKLFTDEVAYDLPNPTLKPKVGDKYILLDIYMPQSYVDEAEAKLLAKATEAIEQVSDPNVTYTVSADPLFIKKVGLTFAPGDYVNIKDSELQIDRDIRIAGIVRNLDNLNRYEFELSDTVEPSLTAQVITTIEATDIILQNNRLKDPARARRAWMTTQELQGAIFDQDGYFDPENIKPQSIETLMLTVGAKSTQFYTDCYFQANHQGNKNSIVVGNGALAHFTISDTVRTWTITGTTQTLPDNNLRYIYATCLKEGSTGQITLSTEQKAIEEGSYYHFFVGVLSSVIDNARQVSLLFGFTSINGRFVKTGRVQSGDGATYFDLDSGEIAGNIKFLSNGEYEGVADGIFENRVNLAQVENWVAITGLSAPPTPEVLGFSRIPMALGTDSMVYYDTPFGRGVVWRIRTGIGTGPHGGFMINRDNSAYNSSLPLNVAMTYRVSFFFQYGQSIAGSNEVFRVAVDAGDSLQVYDGATTSIIADVVPTGLTHGKWYYFVGHIFPGGYTLGLNEKGSFVYDAATGQKVLEYNAVRFNASKVDSLAFMVAKWNAPGDNRAYYLCGPAVTRVNAGEQNAEQPLSDNTVTRINGGVITSGTIQLGDGANIKAGITGQGTPDTSVRIWAGDTYGNRATAPFRVLQDGTMITSKGIFASIPGEMAGLEGLVKIEGPNIYTDVVDGEESAIMINYKGAPPSGGYYKRYVAFGCGNESDTMALLTTIKDVGVAARGNWRFDVDIDLRRKIRVSFAELDYNNVSAGEVYKDANGFLKVK